jgi:hypothetical protein
MQWGRLLKIPLVSRITATSATYDEDHESRRSSDGEQSQQFGRNLASDCRINAHATPLFNSLGASIIHRQR